MEHVEEAGIHSGDSSCVLPGALARRRDVRARSAASCGASGRRSGSSACSTSSSRSSTARSTCSRSNPRASRTVPFASKATGVNLVDAAVPARRRRAPARARAARRAAAGAGEREGGGAAVRALPGRRPRARPRDALDRRGDGERRRPADRVRQGRARRRPAAADRGHGVPVRARRPTRPASSPVAGALAGLGFELVATAGTARALAAAGLDVERRKVEKGERDRRRR